MDYGNVFGFQNSSILEKNKGIFQSHDQNPLEIKNKRQPCLLVKEYKKPPPQSTLHFVLLGSLWAKTGSPRVERRAERETSAAKVGKEYKYVKWRT